MGNCGRLLLINIGITIGVTDFKSFFMLRLKNIFKLIGLGLITISFPQCASTMTLDKEIPASIDKAYYQNWVAGVEGGGSGINIFIETKDESLVLDSIFFRGQVSKLSTKPANKALFIGRFNTQGNSKEFSILNTDDNTKKEINFPFDLKDNECVVSYSKNGETRYFKIQDLEEKPMEALPMAPPPNRN